MPPVCCFPVCVFMSACVYACACLCMRVRGLCSCVFVRVHVCVLRGNFYAPMHGVCAYILFVIFFCCCELLCMCI